MKLKKISTQLIHSSLLTLLIISGAFAEDVKLIGSLKQKLQESNKTSAFENKAKNEKVIQLLRIELSDEKKKLLADQAKVILVPAKQFGTNKANTELDATPNKIQLGMNNVPVLDQGMHGTCVTFAVTGALDAAMGKGDYISQLCNLQLGSYLEQHGYGISGWEGSYAINVINQMEQYGVVSTQKQRSLGCGGLKQYPAYSSHDPKSFIEPEQYRSMSELIFGKTVTWSDVYQKDNAENTLNTVKEVLNSGDRLVFAVMLPRTDLGFVGAVGKYKTWIYKDTWVLTPEILKGLDNIEAAHEMIITGYDDNAVAVDDKGAKHKGLLILRNSWGSSYGDYGDFYMSYDYFKLLAFDVTRFSKYPN